MLPIKDFVYVYTYKCSEMYFRLKGIVFIQVTTLSFNGAMVTAHWRAI